MTNAKIDLMAPEWQMEDAYGDIRSPRYEASVAEALEAVKNLEADTVVINPEPDVHHPAGRWLDKPCKIFVVMVADGADLAPHGTPCLVESRCLRALKLESVHKRRGAFQLQSEAAVVDGLYSFIGDIVDGHSAVDSELQANIAVGRLNRVGCSRQRRIHEYRLVS